MDNSDRTFVSALVGACFAAGLAGILAALPATRGLSMLMIAPIAILAGIALNNVAKRP